MVMLGPKKLVREAGHETIEKTPERQLRLNIAEVRSMVKSEVLKSVDHQYTETQSGSRVHSEHSYGTKRDSSPEPDSETRKVENHNDHLYSADNFNVQPQNANPISVNSGHKVATAIDNRDNHDDHDTETDTDPENITETE